jgi:hypothetical protein
VQYRLAGGSSQLTTDAGAAANFLFADLLTDRAMRMEKDGASMTSFRRSCP